MKSRYEAVCTVVLCCCLPLVSCCSINALRRYLESEPVLSWTRPTCTYRPVKSFTILEKELMISTSILSWMLVAGFEITEIQVQLPGV